MQDLREKGPMQTLRMGFVQASLAVAEAPASQWLVREVYWED